MGVDTVSRDALQNTAEHKQADTMLHVFMASEKLYSIHSVYVMMGRILTYNHLNCFIPMYPYMDKSMQLNPVLHQ